MNWGSVDMLHNISHGNRKHSLTPSIKASFPQTYVYTPEFQINAALSNALDGPIKILARHLTLPRSIRLDNQRRTGFCPPLSPVCFLDSAPLLG
jgi:hypothetical protein